MVPFLSPSPPRTHAERFCQWVPFSPDRSWEEVAFTVKDGNGNCTQGLNGLASGQAWAVTLGGLGATCEPPRRFPDGRRMGCGTGDQ